MVSLETKIFSHRFISNTHLEIKNGKVNQSLSLLFNVSFTNLCVLLNFPQMSRKKLNFLYHISLSHLLAWMFEVFILMFFGRMVSLHILTLPSPFSHNKMKTKKGTRRSSRREVVKSRSDFTSRLGICIKLGFKLLEKFCQTRAYEKMLNKLANLCICCSYIFIC